MRPSRSLRRARRRAPSRSSSRFHPRGLSLSLPLDIVPPLFPRVPSLFFNPRFLLARSSASALCRTLSVSSRARPSSRVTIPVRIGASSAPLSRRCSSFEASLSAAVHNHPPAARSVLVEFAARSPLRHRAHLRVLLARALHPFRRSVSVSIRSETALYFSLLFSPPSRLPFPSPSFSLSPCVFFLRPTLFRSTFMYRLASGMRDVHHTSARVRTCAPRPSFSRSSRAAGRRACSNRFDTRSWGKKNGRMYRRRLSPRRVNTPRPRVRARATRALGQWRNFSRFFLLPFCIGPAFRIYLRVIRFAAGYNMRLASRRMDAAGVR